LALGLGLSFGSASIARPAGEAAKAEEIKASAGVLRPAPGWARLFAQVVVACVAMTAFLYWVQWLIGDWLVLTTWKQIGALTICVGGGAVVYFGTCLVSGVKPRALRAPV
jgi:peptidoglycan biosynthesis protein MviN/MurJ (putative lipid II flippase)